MTAPDVARDEPPSMAAILALWAEPLRGREALRAFEKRVPAPCHPPYAAALLAAVQPLFARRLEVDVLYAMAADSRRWPEGTAAFEVLRRASLAVEQAEDRSAGEFLALAEDVAKTIANAACDADEPTFKPGRALEVAARASALAREHADGQVQRDVARALAIRWVVTSPGPGSPA